VNKVKFWRDGECTTVQCTQSKTCMKGWTTAKHTLPTVAQACKKMLARGFTRKPT